MNKEYIIKKRPKIPEDLIALERKKRDKIEKIMGRKLSDFEWNKYKELTLLKNKNL